LQGDGAPAQLRPLELTPSQLKAFSAAEPGDALNLSSEEIAQLKRAGKDAGAVTEAVRALVLARYRAYRSKGLPGIAPYARARAMTSPADDLAKVNQNARATGILPASFFDLLENYPRSAPSDLEQNLFWAQFTANGADTIALTHVFQGTFDGTVVIVQRQYYV